ncbi:MAG: DsbA family protein [Litorimonas sp.]
MVLKSYIIPHIAEKRLSQKRLDASRVKFETHRKKSGAEHVVEFFHDPTDPYSQLLSKVLPEFQKLYDVKLVTHIVSPPDDQAAPQRAKLAAYAKLDAMRLASKAKIDFKLEATFSTANTVHGDERRKALGHYNGAMLYYGAEWYWGLDRLHYLESRLTTLGLRCTNTKQNYIYEPAISPIGSGKVKAQINWYLSFRSPYTAIVTPKVKALANAYGADLVLRPVLPMVMRGLAVPTLKKNYIPFDAAREARRMNVPFGKICDPIGRPVEMAYSLMAWAQEHGKAYDYAQSWLSAVWSEGVNAGTHAGLRIIIERAGLDWADAKRILGNDDWRESVADNQSEMMSYGIWGVPSFRVGDTITWGQDRLWVIEDTLRKLRQ